jgi:leucyl-tRNA synthetase
MNHAHIDYSNYRASSGALVSAEHVEEGAEGYVRKGTTEPVAEERIDEGALVKRGNFFVLKDQPEIRVNASAHKMSKSRGNVINPDDIVKAHGADALRLYEMFMGPLEAVKPWQSSQIQGVVRFRDRVNAIADKPLGDAIDDATNRLVHKTVKKVTAHIEALAFNTAISAMMVLSNHLAGLDVVPRQAAEKLVLIVSPFAPHLGEELWRKLGHPASLAYEPWPSYDEALCVEEEVELPVQVNGKVRAVVAIARTASEDEARKAALEADAVRAFIEGKTIRKFVYVPGKIANLVVS